MTRGLFRSAFALISTLGLVACGPSNPTPHAAEDRWLGAQPIGNLPEGRPGCNLSVSPRLAMDARGGAMSAWLSDCSVWAARYEPGQGWLRPEIIGSLPDGAPANWIWEPALAVNDSGTALVTWTTQIEAGEGKRQVWARIGQGSSGWSAPERIGDTEPGPLSEIDAPGAALDRDGNGLVVWGSQGIVAVRLVAGRRWEAAERLSREGSEFLPNVFLDPAGRGFAIWNEPFTAVVSRFDPRGGFEEPTRFDNEDGWSFGGPGRMAFAPDGRAVLLWQRNLGRLRPSAIWSTTFDRDAWAPWIRVSAEGAANDPRVGLDATGAGLAAWNEPSGPASARLDARGWSEPRAAVSSTASDPQSLSLAVNGRGDGILAWSQSVEPQAGIEGSRYVNGQWTALERLRMGRARNPVAALDACGNAIVLWGEYEGQRVRIWGNRFEAGCR